MAAKRRRIRKKENEERHREAKVISTLRPTDSDGKRLAVQGPLLFCVSCAFSRLNPAPLRRSVWRPAGERELISREEAQNTQKRKRGLVPEG